MDALVKLPTWLFAVIMISWTAERIYGQDSSDELVFTFKGAKYPNGGYILLSEIGEGPEDVLFCITTRADCCTGDNAAGEFHFPNDNVVPERSEVRNNGMFRERGDQQIRLRRVSSNSVTSDVVGLYSCNIPDRNGNNLRISINIVDSEQLPPTFATPIRATISLQSSGVESIGQQFNLTCIASLGGSIDTLTITWLDGNSMTVPSGGGDTRVVSTMMSIGSAHTSVLQFVALDALHAGRYTCVVSAFVGTIRGTSSFPVLTNGFLFRGSLHPDNSYILLSDIGEGNDALICTTTRTDCCSGNNTVGEFCYPNENLVPTRDNVRSNGMYIIRDNQQINLSRVSSFTSNVTGLYSCGIPWRDSNGNTIIVYLHVNIVMVTIEPITTSGTNSAGQQFNLTCTATVVGSIDTPTITWLDGNSMTVPSGGGDTRMVSTVMSSGSTHTSILQFDPLQSSHAGMYTCQVQLKPATKLESFNVTVVIPTPVVTISSPDTILVGSTLACNIELSETVDTDVTVNTVWSGPSGTQLNTTTPAMLMSGTTYTSTATLSLLDSSDSGVYTCSATVSPQNSLFVKPSDKVSGMENITIATARTLELIFQGALYPSGGYILLSEIGEDSVVICTTTRTDCCSGSNAVGEFHFPNGNRVPIKDEVRTNGMYIERGDSQISLGRVSSFDSTVSGLYWCSIPELDGSNQIIYINIVKELPSTFILPVRAMVTLEPIVSSDVNTAGHQFNLTCNATVSIDLEGRIVTPTITWFHGKSMIVPSGGDDTRMVSTVMSSDSTYTSILQFNPLQSSHAGTYTCQVSVLAGTVIDMRSTDVTVAFPDPTVMIDIPAGTLYAGTLLQLTCTITVDDSVNTDVEVNVTWTPLSDRLSVEKTTGLKQKYSSVMMVSPLASQDTEFTCSAVIQPLLGSSFITASGPVMDTKNVTVQVPESPSAMEVTISTTGLSIIGDPFDMTCQVTFIENLVQPPDVMWTGPGINETNVKIVGPIMSGPVTTLSLSFSPLHINHGGQYTCRAVLDIPKAGFPQVINTRTQDVTVFDTQFQLRLMEIGNCDNWINDRPIAKASEIATAVETKIEQRCQCNMNFTVGNGGFRCMDSKTAVVYRAAIHRSEQITTSEVIRHIEDWVTSGTGIVVQSLFINIDSSCGVLVRDVNDECPLRLDAKLLPTTSTQSSQQATDSDHTRELIIGGTVLAAIVAITLILALAVVKMTYPIVKKKSTQKCTSKDTRAIEHPALNDITLSDFSQSTGSYCQSQSKEMDYDYEEIVDSGFRVSSGTQRSSGGYVFSQCPAYEVPSIQAAPSTISTSSGDPSESSSI